MHLLQVTEACITSPFHMPSALFKVTSMHFSRTSLYQGNGGPRSRSHMEGRSGGVHAARAQTCRV